MSKKIIILLVLFFTFSISVCAQQKFVANLTGRQQVPSNESGSSGICDLWVENNATVLRVDCIHFNLSGTRTGLSINTGSIGANGSAIINASAPGSGNPIEIFSLTQPGFTAQNLADLYANRLYIVIKSGAFPDGEIRGQFHVANGAYNDFDGDGRTDLTVYRNSNNTFYTQSSLTGNLTTQPLGQPGDSVSLTVDFTGDGRSDFSTARYSSEIVWRFVRSSDGAPSEVRWGSSALGDFFAAADYDGNTQTDVAVFRAGVWHILESATGTVRYEYFGQSGDVPAPNDYDRDGKADLAVARSENGQRVWHIRRSSDGSYYSVTWGLSSDAFFTGRADWDGDGAADISVIRNESGQRVFYILRSSDQQLQVIRWGLSSDVVKLGDYDGDGKTDAAVTRAVNGQRVFYILQSSTGEARYETFGLQGDF
jgi:hypothetical protein